MNKPTLSAGTAFGLNPTDELNDLRMSEAALPLRMRPCGSSHNRAPLTAYARAHQRSSW